MRSKQLGRFESSMTLVQQERLKCNSFIVCGLSQGGDDDHSLFSHWSEPTWAPRTGTNLTFDQVFCPIKIQMHGSFADATPFKMSTSRRVEPYPGLFES